MYASSMTSIVPVSSSRSTSPAGIGLPVGLFGVGMKTAFASIAASTSASASKAQSASSGTSITSAPVSCALKAYIPKVGEAVTTRSPSSTKSRKINSISSSDPAPHTTDSAGTPRCRPIAPRSAFWSASP